MSFGFMIWFDCSTALHSSLKLLPVISLVATRCFLVSFVVVSSHPFKNFRNSRFCRASAVQSKGSLLKHQMFIFVARLEHFPGMPWPAPFEPRQYAEWIHGDIFQPVIVVIGTPNAKTRIKEINGLSLAELFAPFWWAFSSWDFGISATSRASDRQRTCPSSIHGCGFCGPTESAPSWPVGRLDSAVQCFGDTNSFPECRGFGST